MDKTKVKEALRKGPGIQDVEEIEYKPDFLVLRFFYVYDEDELEAAKDYANSQSTTDEEDKWYEEYYIPYIIDIAVDEVRETIEEIVDETNLNSEYISYEPERDAQSCEFVVVFGNEGVEFDIDEVLESIGL